MNEVTQLRARVLSHTIQLLFLASLATIIIGGVVQNWQIVGVLAGGLLFILLSMFVLKRAHMQLSAIILLSGLFTVSFLLQYFGQGIHDLGMMLYPITIILSALWLQRWKYWLITAVSIVLNVSIVLLEKQNILPNKVFLGDPWRDLLIMLVLFILVAVGAHLLTKQLWQYVADAQRNEAALLSSKQTLERRTYTLQKSEKEARDFQEKLQTLHEVSFELVDTQNLSELYRKTIILGRERLGFDRLGLLLYDHTTQMMYGTFGTDEFGNLRDESYFSQKVTRQEILDLLEHKKRMGYWAGEAIMDNGKVIGHGWHATAVLWSGERGIGYLSTDNYIRKEPPTQIRLDLLTLYGATVGHLIEIKTAELNLQKYARELERSNRELQDFAFVSSHDLQEPLRKIQAFSDRLLKKYDGVLDERGVDYLQRMQSAAARMQTLIQDVLTLSKVNTARLNVVQVDLQAIIDEVLKDFAEKVNQPHVHVHGLPTIEANPTQMWRLLQNIIGNALKFHRPDEPVKIEIWAERFVEDGQEMTTIQIKDNGIGFAQQDGERVFDMFHRLHNRSQFEGSGMGLAICQRIVERHNGRIEVKSKPNKGSTFMITLPLSQPASPKIAN